MRLILYYILLIMVIIFILEILMIFHKRTLLLIKLKRACKRSGCKMKCKGFPFLSVLLRKGRLDLLIESDCEKYAVVIITSRQRKGKFVFYEDKLEIWRKKRLSFSSALGGGRAGILMGGKSIDFGAYMKLKEKINLKFGKIARDYPLHKGICLINPAPRQVCISFGTTHRDIHDGARLHSGFTVYGLKGFARLLDKTDN